VISDAILKVGNRVGFYNLFILCLKRWHHQKKYEFNRYLIYSTFLFFKGKNLLPNSISNFWGAVLEGRDFEGVHLSFPDDRLLSENIMFFQRRVHNYAKIILR
jgi:hypothetical protein